MSISGLEIKRNTMAFLFLPLWKGKQPHWCKHPTPNTHTHTHTHRTTSTRTHEIAGNVRRFVRTLYKILNPQCRHRTGSPFLMRLRTPQSPQRYSTPFINGIAPVVVVVVAVPATDAAPPGVFIIESRCCLSSLLVSLFLVVFENLFYRRQCWIGNCCGWMNFSVAVWYWEWCRGVFGSSFLVVMNVALSERPNETKGIPSP